MKTLYLDCGMGAAGDMLAAALLELLPEPGAFVNRLNGLGLPGVTFALERSVKCGITGSHLTVLVGGQEEGEHDHHGRSHTHRGLREIRHLVEDHLQLSEAVRQDVLAVYDRIAQAESQVHGVPVEEIHFHEVGTLDAVADITAVCLLMHTLAPQKILASPVRVGSGQVRCAHGLLPVPAPATALLLRGGAHLCRGSDRRALHPHWSGPADSLCDPVWPHAGDAGGGNRLWHGEEGFSRGQLRPRHAGRDGGRGGHRVPAGVQPGRHDPGGPGLCPGAAVGRGSSGRLYRAHRHEEVPPWGAAGLPVPGGGGREVDGVDPPPHHHPGGPPDKPHPVTVKETPDGRGKPEYEEAATIARREGLTLSEVQEAAMEEWRAARVKP